MSLVDALLLEPAPFEVWIAIRPDRQKGSGRIDDPYDGSTTHDPSVAINSIVPSGDQQGRPRPPFRGNFRTPCD